MTTYQLRVEADDDPSTRILLPLPEFDADEFEALSVTGQFLFLKKITPEGFYPIEFLRDGEVWKPSDAYASIRRDRSMFTRAERRAMKSTRSKGERQV